MLILETVLLLGYFFAQALSLAGEVFPALTRYSTAIFAAGLLALAIAGVLAAKKWPKLNSHNPTALVVGHLLLYGAIFVSYNKFETHYASMGDAVLGANFSMSFFNTAAIFALALASAFLIPRVLSAPFMQKYLRKGTLTALGCVSAYAAFAALGDSLFFQYEFSAITLMVYLLGVLWMFPLTLEVLALFELLRARLTRAAAPEKHARRTVWLACFGAFAAVWLVYLIAFNPAQMSPDSMGMWAEATSGKPITYQQHPPFVMFLWRLLTYIVPHPMFIALAQIVSFAALCASFMLEFYKRGIRLRALLIFAAVFALLPSSGLMITTLWSNIPYTISLLYLTYAIWRVCSPDKGKIIPYINIALALALTWATRPTGFLPAILCAALLLFLSLRKGFKPNLLAAAAAGCALIFLIEVPLYSAIVADDAEEASSPWLTLMDGLQSVVYYGGDLPDETRAFMESYMPLAQWKENYSVYDVNVHSYPKELSEHSQEDGFLGEVFGHYIATLQREPLLLIKNRLSNSNLVWGVAQPKGSYNERVMTGTSSGNIGFPHSDNPLTFVLKRILFPVSIAIAPLDILIYRGGVYIILSMLLCVFLASHKKLHMGILFFPMLGDIMALLIAMDWPVFRNIWFIPVIFAFIAPLLLSETTQSTGASPP